MAEVRVFFEKQNFVVNCVQSDRDSFKPGRRKRKWREGAMIDTDRHDKSRKKKYVND